MEKPLVSIIIPLYNVQEYVGECIESILKQSYEHFEVVVMDDGSTDNSAEICKKYVDRDMRVKYFRQENQGVASARKNAAKKISGQYVMFVDADDYIGENLLEELMLKTEEYDLVTSGYYNGYGKNVKCFDGIEEGAYYTQEDLKYVCANMIFKDDQMGILRTMWAKLYQAELVKKVFEEIDENIIWGEDGDFLYRYILKCKSISVTRVCGYHYRMRESSAVHSVNKEYLRNIDSVYQALEPVFTSHVYSHLLLPQLQRWVMQMINQAPYYLGFPLEMHNTPYSYPDLKTIAGKNVIIYGAGNVGRSYKVFFEKYGICNVVLWVDKNARLEECDRVESILNIKYEYIVLAIKQVFLAEEIRKELTDLGVENHMILWHEPLEQ